MTSSVVWNMLVALGLLQVAFAQDLTHEAARVLVNAITEATLNYIRDTYRSSSGELILPPFSTDTTFGPRIETGEGVFRDLRTLEKCEDVFVAKKNNLWKLKFLVQLKTVNIYYPEFTAKYIVRKNGSLDVTIDGVTIDLTVTAAYCQKSCTLSLESIKADSGKTNVKTTGLGEYTGKIVDFITSEIGQYRKDDVEAYLERQLGIPVAKSLKKFDCEKYRPSKK